MKKRHLIRNVFTAALLAITAPTLATAATALSPESEQSHFSAFSNFTTTELASIDSLSNAEMSEIQGEFFNFGINIAILPQINICVLCFNVTQINDGTIIGINMLQ